MASQHNARAHVEQIRAWLSAKLAERLGIDAATIDVNEPFASYGLDSAEAVSLSGELEEWLGRELPATLIYDYPSIELLARYTAGAPAGERVEARVAPTETVAEGPRALPNRPEPIAIVGIGCRFPGGRDQHEFWQTLRAGATAIGEVPADRWNIDDWYDPDPEAAGKMYTRHAGCLPELWRFDNEFFGISPREAVRMDPQQRLLLEVAWEALENAGLRPEQLAGSRTGVFVGLMNTHQYTQLQTNHGDGSYADDPYFGLGASASIASGRLSYLLNLRGPNLCVDTACSSSLVAVHLACQSLRNDECGLALVGGVNAIVLPDTMVTACKMGMLAADGRCKTFEAAADGFVLGEGCGWVVLKRLSEAQADGDNILALIRGSAVNQDGRSNGITAPNGLAQQAVIRQALANAGVRPQDVAYVETHGSGTALGDPIEVAALQATLGDGRPREHPLAIGAVKANIGHLAGAAGIAGLIKTVLALRHAEIPPHPAVEQLNPTIAWDRNAVAVATKLTPWSSDDGPRFAGVSSFGWSGTNAHVVLEEAPVHEPSDPSKPWQLLLLSAKNPGALESATENLLTYLKDHPDAELADVAYTYQVGRQAFGRRRMLVCDSRSDAVATLESRDPRRILSADPAAANRQVVFLFPGVGEQYTGMAAELYRHEPYFRAQVDRCAELLEPHLGLDLRELLYPATTSVPDGKAPVATQAGIDLRHMLRRGTGAGEAGDGRLDETSLAQPAMFVIEYALAQLWLSWGVQPQAMIGYSLGEYVAACLAGVLSLEDALALVAKRAQLIAGLPRGAMLAVDLAEQEVQPLLGRELSIAAINGPSLCVVAGPPAAVDALEQRLTLSATACRRLRTSHAFHSAMMEPIMKSVTDLLATIELHPPRIPYISNVTGTWITAEQATDPHYWAGHLRRTVRLADGIEMLWQQPGAIFLEVGPGQTLGSLLLQHPAAWKAADAVVLPSLRNVYDRQSDQAFLLRSLGQLWLAGVAVVWAALHAKERRRCVEVPTYPFGGERFSMAALPRLHIVRPHTNRDDRRRPLADWFYVPTWKQARPWLGAELDGLRTSKQHYLLFADACGVGGQLAERLQRHGHDVSVVTAGETFRRIGDGAYTINPQAADDYVALLKHLHLVHKAPRQIVHAWSLTPADHAELTIEGFEKAQQSGFRSLLFLAQALGHHHASEAIRLIVLSNQVHDVLGGEELRPEKATLLGPCKVIPKEYANITCRNVDLVPAEPGTPEAEALTRQLVAECGLDSSADVVAYRGNRRWTQFFEPLRLQDHPPSAAPLREGGVYLITGGFGGLGYALAEHLARTVRAKLILVNRSGVLEGEQGQLARPGETSNGKVGDKIGKLMALQAAGAEVLAVAADVADSEQMRLAVEQAHARFGKIDGVFHVAGVPGEGLMQLKTPSMAARVFAPKVLGTLVLDAVLRDEQLDFMALYSSSGAVTGGLGEVDYCAANAFLDAFAHRSASRGRTATVSINWGPWQADSWQTSLSIALPDVYVEIKQLRERYGIGFDDGHAALHRILASSLSQVMVLTQSLETTVEQWDALSAKGLLDRAVETRVAAPCYPRPNLRNPYAAPRNETEQSIAEIWQAALGIEQVGIHDHFFELGGSSLIGMRVVAQLQKEFKVQLSAASLYEGPTISALGALIRPEHNERSTLAHNSSRGQLRRERLRQQRPIPQKAA